MLVFSLAWCRGHIVGVYRLVGFDLGYGRRLELDLGGLRPSFQILFHDIAALGLVD